MVFVKVRETYDLHTVKNKMTVIGIHTPKADIIKKNFPGLLMQCKCYRPYSCDVRVACASVLPLDPKGVGLTEDDVAPEDIFNPILYKAMSNKGMSQLEARINLLAPTGGDIAGPSADVDVDSITNKADEFSVYYGLLSNAHDWRHANPQQGLEMRGLRPLVYDLVYNVGDNDGAVGAAISYFAAPKDDGDKMLGNAQAILGSSKPMPFINCTSYSYHSAKTEGGSAQTGFINDPELYNAEVFVNSLPVMVGCIIVPPSRLHELFYRMVVEWTLEFSSIRPLCEITDFTDLGRIGDATHFQNYSYESTKKAITGDSTSILDSDSCMVSANVGIKKVM